MYTLIVRVFKNEFRANFDTVSEAYFKLRVLQEEVVVDDWDLLYNGGHNVESD